MWSGVTQVLVFRRLVELIFGFFSFEKSLRSIHLLCLVVLKKSLRRLLQEADVKNTR